MLDKIKQLCYNSKKCFDGIMLLTINLRELAVGASHGESEKQSRSGAELLNQLGSKKLRKPRYHGLGFDRIQ